MELTPAHLNRATLARQSLLGRAALSVVDGIRRVVGLQAQEPASPYIALWNRLEGFDPADLDAAFAGHAVVKATLMRITLHAVAAEDHPALHAAMLPNLRASRLGDKRFTGPGLTVADADAALPRLLEHVGEPRTKDEIEALFLDEHGEEASPWLWWALRTFAPLVHAPRGAPWSFDTRKAYRAAPPPQGAPPDHESGVEHLVVRYLEAFGPATIADVGQFALLQRAKVRAAVERLG
ncbi:MAG: winged helix DNA-binding domain-containing protein, partial [Actinobacteria bacterium]|nr:winged helix DNA-binding domain-containing protein [Actinomycetota bacterium]